MKGKTSLPGGPELPEVWESEQPFGKSIGRQCSGGRAGPGQDVGDCWRAGVMQRSLSVRSTLFMLVKLF